jgi:hypothetical protein
MRKTSSGVIAMIIFLLVVCTAPASVKAAAELTPLYTPPAGGTAYVLGVGIVSVTNK